MSAAEVRLRDWSACGGCAAKWGASPLAALVDGLRSKPDAKLLVGLAPFDDAAVYRVSPDTALVSTTDFFPPMVDDPADFGAIAAANACSDVFAMGGEVILALNIAAFPEELPTAAIETIFASAARVVEQAGGTVAGGHTIRSQEPIFGLAVQGVVHPDRIWTKAGAVGGDVLVLSKPIGSGIVLAGGTPGAIQRAVEVMKTLNRESAEELKGLPIPPHAVTDVTGFGLLGHCWEMAERSGVTIEISARLLPIYEGALEAARAGTRTGGDARNRAHLAGRVVASVDPDLEALAYDPQTSGGLLAAVDSASARRLSDTGRFTTVGTITAGPAGVRLN